MNDNMKTSLISAREAYDLAHKKSKEILYYNIYSAASCGALYYDVESASIEQNTIDELVNVGYDISQVGSYIRISWKIMPPDDSIS